MELESVEQIVLNGLGGDDIVDASSLTQPTALIVNGGTGNARQPLVRLTTGSSGTRATATTSSMAATAPTRSSSTARAPTKSS